MKIIKKLKENYDVYSDSVPGCGKTTTVLNIAKMMKEKNILMLTYNSDIRYEVIEKNK